VKKSYKAPKSISKPLQEAKYLYSFKLRNKELQRMLFLPINRLLHERKMTWEDMASELNQKGFKCTKSSLAITQQGNNFYCVDFNYFTRIYEVLNLPPVTLDYLIECRDRYNELRPKRKLNKL